MVGLRKQTPKDEEVTQVKSVQSTGVEEEQSMSFAVARSKQ